MPWSSKPKLLSVGSFLPGEPIGNDRIEEMLGCIGGKASRTRRLILRRNGIRQRHYALDPETQQQTHTNARMTAEAVRVAARDAGLELSDVDTLVCGTSSPDVLMPNHALMVQAELGLSHCEVAATSGTCLSGLTALKYAAMAVASGQARHAVATGSEISSNVLRSANFPADDEAAEALERDPVMAFGQDFLRWMLSDGAGALWVSESAGAGLHLEIDWIEIVSFAGELEPCMYWGGQKRADGSLQGWRETSGLAESAQLGMFNLTQDVRLLGAEATRTTVAEALARVLERQPLRPDQVDWFLPHYSSEFFRDEVAGRLCEIEFEIPFERWFTNLSTKGNTGSASIYIMLDELFRSGRLKPGEKILCYVPESARFSVGYMLLTVAGGAG